MSVSASENGEMSVNTETVKTGCSEANSHPSLQLSECTGNHNIIPTMTEVTLAISDGSDVAATCPEQATVGQINHTSLTDTQSHTENAGQKARGNENPLNRRRSLHHPKQQQQQKPPKRRNTMVSGFKHPTSGKRRRRANSESDSVLPTNFLLGGNISDPLNLNSLLDEEVNRALNAETPKSSPLPAKSRDPVEIIIPRDIRDPLDLNSGMANSNFLMSPFKKKRHRNRHHGGGNSAMHPDLSESAKSSEVKTSSSTLPPVPDVPRGTSTLSTTPGDSHDYKESKSSSCEERLTTSAPQARGTEDSASAASGGPSQHSSKRKRRRHAGKADPPVFPSTPIRKPGSAERCHAQAFQTPKSGPRSGGQQQQSYGQHKRQQQQQRFEYGNYSKYYGYRNPGTSEDPRVHMLRPEWFQGKEVLDLGCNSGHLTLYIAKMLRPARILGLDIDSGLIHAARKNIRHYLSEQQTQEARRATQEKKSTKQESDDSERLQGRKTQTVKQEQDRDNGRESGPENGKADRAGQGESGPAEAVKDNVSTCHADDREPRGRRCEAEEREKEGCKAPPASQPFPVSLQITRGPIAAPLVTETPTAPPGKFPHNVSFIKANYVLENDRLLLTQRPEYDVILCLSVTKWVHLNWGDGGLKRLFQRAYRHLNPGGLFILEPQPWDSYNKRKKLSENTFRNYHSIRLKPDHFSTYLTSEVGFSSYELIGTPMCSARGFQRPIYLFHK